MSRIHAIFSASTISLLCVGSPLSCRPDLGGNNTKHGSATGTVAPSPPVNSSQTGTTPGSADGANTPVAPGTYDPNNPGSAPRQDGKAPDGFVTDELSAFLKDAIYYRDSGSDLLGSKRRAGTRRANCESGDVLLGVTKVSCHALDAGIFANFEWFSHGKMTGGDAFGVTLGCDASDDEAYDGGYIEVSCLKMRTPQKFVAGTYEKSNNVKPFEADAATSGLSCNSTDRLTGVLSTSCAGDAFGVGGSVLSYTSTDRALAASCKLTQLVEGAKDSAALTVRCIKIAAEFDRLFYEKSVEGGALSCKTGDLLIGIIGASRGSGINIVSMSSGTTTAAIGNATKILCAKASNF